ncbi:hypothetical protein [uncultured Pseudoteredinibacter sp.]|uniref:hypothetical protein n=1 Tax=uncultured Pseudoteredinibacter sp. TaxID=1641701 RepID=UPI002603F617|nr:hypothetical protein [uncultured Pseudoteredinibacter sp.]
MLSILYPNLVPEIEQANIGIFPIPIDNDEFVLIVKAPKEFILTAKANGEIAVYVIPLILDNTKTIGLVTAFFDDEDEPLMISTPLWNDEASMDLLRLVTGRKLDIHFFDDHSRELLQYHATIDINDVVVERVNNARFLEFSYPRAWDSIDQMSLKFCTRDSVDDQLAVKITLEKAVYGEDIFIQDARTNLHSYVGARGFSHTMLEREEPGQYQEEDIVRSLFTIFTQDQIYLNPLRTYDKEEVCDILVVTDKTVLLVQAKDSPNTERVLGQTLQRKRKNALKALKKAVAQTKGAIGYYDRIPEIFEFLINKDLYSIPKINRKLRSLIVVKELFVDQSDVFSPLVLEIFEEKGNPCLPLDYLGLRDICIHCRNQDEFFDCYDKLTESALNKGIYPEFRFGPKE